MARITVNPTSYTTNSDGTVTVNFTNKFGETVSGARLHSLLIDDSGIEAISVTNTSATFDLSYFDNISISFAFEVEFRAPTMAGLIVPETITTGIGNMVQIKVPTSAPGVSSVSDITELTLNGVIDSVAGHAVTTYNFPSRGSDGYIYFSMAVTSRVLTGAHDIVFHLDDWTTGSPKTIATSNRYRVYIDNEGLNRGSDTLNNIFIPDRKLTFFEQGHSYVLDLRTNRDFEHCTFWVHYVHTNGKNYRMDFGEVKGGKLNIYQEKLDSFDIENVVDYNKISLRNPDDSSIEVGFWDSSDFGDTFLGIMPSETALISHDDKTIGEEDI